MKNIRLWIFIGICLYIGFIAAAGGEKDISSFQAPVPEGGSVDVTQYAKPLPSAIPVIDTKNIVQNADSIITLTIDQAVSYAVDNSRTMQSALVDLDIKQRQKELSWNVFIPTINASGTVARINEVQPFTIPGMPLPPAPAATEADHWSATASVSASLNLNAALFDGLKSMRVSYEAGLITWEQTRKQTERDITRMFYSILLMQENLKLQQDMLKTAQQRVTQSQANFRNGLVPELTVLQSQVAYENRKPAVQELEYTVNQQLQMFAFLLGFPFGTQIILDGKIEPEFLNLNADELVSEYVGNRLDIISLQKNIELMQLQSSITKMQMYTPNLSISYGLSTKINEIDKNWFEKDNRGDNGQLSISLMFSPSNWFPFSQAAQNIQNTEANIAKMQLNLATAIQNAEMEISNLVNKLDKSKSSIAASSLNISLAQKAYDLTVTAFKNGTKELLDVRDAESQLNQAQLGLLQEKFNYVSSLLDLEYAINGKL